MSNSVVAFIVVLGVLIFVHELGHFLVARLCGVGVEKFSLGFGPRLLGRTVGITDYRISAIPLGGYVKMVGDEPDAEVPEAQLPLSFTHKPVLQRILIVAAGPFFNVLLAVLIYFLTYLAIGIDDVAPVINHVATDSPAGQAGFQVGDRLVSIDGRRVQSWFDIASAVERGDGRPMTIEIRRDDQLRKAAVTPAAKNRTDVFGDEKIVYDLGIAAFPEPLAVVGEVTPESPAQQAGIQPGDRIVAIDGTPVTNWEQMRRLITGSGGQPLAVTIERASEQIDIRLIPKRLNEKSPRSRFVIGITAKSVALPEDQRIVRRFGPLQAFTESLRQTAWVTELTVVSVVRMIQGRVSLDNIGGPIMIAQMAGSQAREGFDQLLQFIAFISINLAFLNILPIPVLDGGHLLFFLVEAVIRRPVNLRVREVAQQVGLFILIMLMVLVFYNDIARSWSGWFN